MPRTATQNTQSKFARYRASKKKKGLKLLRIWVPDVNAPGFTEEAARQAAILRGAAEEREILAFIDAATMDWDLEPYDWGPEGPPPGSMPGERT